ncbi:MAG: class I SAM-dependent methyltransferase [Opitutaceae bacterium]|nr:class I SAM-dependent methyltransferase [Opitutaceae bacterium]
MNSQFWDNRYTPADFVYGTAPNDFLRQCANYIPAGPVLCLGEGEGRNAVFLASRGYRVTAVDQSAVGLAKAERLAAQCGVSLNTEVVDLRDYTIEPESWSAIVSIFVHLPPPLRRDVHSAAAIGLHSGGVLILEAYTPAQVRHKTGGPVDAPELLMTLEQLRGELIGLELEIGRELERDLIEGPAHTGRAAVVQVLARRG